MVMRGIIPAVYANGNSLVGGLVLLEACQLEVEGGTWAVLYRRQGATLHAIADRVRRAVEVGRGRAGAEEAALGGGWGGWGHGYTGHAVHPSAILHDLAEKVELRERQLIHEFPEIIEGEEGDGGGEGPSVHS